MVFPSRAPFPLSSFTHSLTRPHRSLFDFIIERVLLHRRRTSKAPERYILERRRKEGKVLIIDLYYSPYSLLAPAYSCASSDMSTHTQYIRISPSACCIQQRHEA